MSEEDISRRLLEEDIIRTAKMLGIHICRHESAKDALDMFANIRLIQNVPFTNVWGYEGRSEFVLQSQIPARSIRIECKYQNGSGSTDDKLVKTVVELQTTIPEDESILVIDGIGWDKRKIQKVKEWAANGKFGPKALAVMSATEFKPWLRTFCRARGAAA